MAAQESRLALIGVLFTGLVLSAGAAGIDESDVMTTDEICSIRPDICSEGESNPSRVRKPSRSKARTASKPKPTCRQQGESFSLADGDLPPCPARGIASVEPERSVSPSARPRRKRISFTSYLNANSNHGALSGGFGRRQDAFQTPPRGGTLTDPTATDSNSSNSATPGTLTGAPSLGTPGAGAAPGGVAPAGNAAGDPPPKRSNN
ncbi:MAG: hypothetical protein AB7F86_17550 [Bdellovibrionales bacterium]